MKIYTVYYSLPVSHRRGSDVKQSQEAFDQLVSRLTPEGFRVDVLHPGRGEDLLELKDIPLPPSEDSETGFIPGRHITRLEIVRRNFDDIKASDFVFCNLLGALEGSTTFIPNVVLDSRYRSDGCLSEMSFACALDKSGLLAMEPKGNINDRFFQSRILPYRAHSLAAGVVKMMTLMLPRVRSCEHGELVKLGAW